MHLPQQLHVPGVHIEVVLWGQPEWPFQTVPEVHLHQEILKLWLLGDDLQFWSLVGISFQARPGQYVTLPAIPSCQQGSFFGLVSVWPLGGPLSCSVTFLTSFFFPSFHIYLFWCCFHSFRQHVGGSILSQNLLTVVFYPFTFTVMTDVI